MKWDILKECFKEEELNTLLIDLIKIKSQNTKESEEELALYIKALLEKNGFEVKLEYASEGRPNLYTTLKGGKEGKKILFNGHLDTVPVSSNWSVDPFSSVIKDGCIYGRGAADMKSGLAAMIYSLIMIKRNNISFSGEVTLFLNVDEEVSNLGMKKFLEGDLQADMAIIGEPTDLDICLGHKGVGRYRIKTNGDAGHIAFIDNPNNAITDMVNCISSINLLREEVNRKEDNLLGNASLNVTKIKGGKAANIVPDFCEIEIDRRVLPGETRESVLNELESNLIKNKCKYNIENYLFLPASSIEENHELVKKLDRSIEEVSNIKPVKKAFKASCEAPFLSVEKGIPTVIFGPGRLNEAHIDDEYVEIKKLYESSLIYTKFLLNL